MIKKNHKCGNFLHYLQSFLRPAPVAGLPLLAVIILAFSMATAAIAGGSRVSTEGVTATKSTTAQWRERFPDGGRQIAAADNGGEKVDAQQLHAALFKEKRFPSAFTCAECHPKQFEEWSVSQHAYGQMSPLVMALQNIVNIKTSTTNGDFCVRCHAPIAAALPEPLSMSNLKRKPASRESATCIACHRVQQKFANVAGRFHIVEGDIYSPVFGPTGNKNLKAVLDDEGKYRVNPVRGEPGRAIHSKVGKFFYQVTPDACAGCHDVVAQNGLRGHFVMQEYKASKAAKNGVTCNDCHMGKVQGKKSGYDFGPAATIGDVPTKPRKLSSHFFAGPDYSIIHPGIFPHSVEASRFKTMEEWIKFDVGAGWGTDDFEDSIGDDYKFPEAWESIDDRYDGREIIDAQLERLKWAKSKRVEVMRNAIGISDIKIGASDGSELGFSVDVFVKTNGHSVPTGLAFDRPIWLQVTVKNADGDIVYQSGDRDPNGDFRNRHSLYVRNGKVPLDDDLFNLQNLFIARLLVGGEREFLDPVNISPSAIPFTRPDERATQLYGRNIGIRQQRNVMTAGSRRTASYGVDGRALAGGGKFQIDIKLISQSVPVNFVSRIMAAGFDFYMTPKQVADRIIAGAIVIERKTISVYIPNGS